MRLVLATVSLSLALVAGGLLAPAAAKGVPVWNGRDDLKEVKALCKEYLDAEPERRAEIRAFLDGLGTLTPADAKKHRKALLKAVRKHGPKMSRKSGEVFEHGGLSSKVYTAGKPKRNWPLFLALHGGGEGSGDGKTALQKWSFVQSKAFVLAPTAPELRGSAWNQADIQAWLLALIEAAKRSFSIDTNRIYVAGHSMGGYGTWSLGCLHADRFAALGACAGGVFVVRGAELRIAPGHVPNLLNTPIYFYNSTDDPRVRPESSQLAHKELLRLKEEGYAYEWVYDEYDDIGHGTPPKGLKPIVDWMLKKKRDPYPKRIVWERTRTKRTRFGWIGCEGDGRIEAQIDGNTIAVTTSGRGTPFTIYLNDEMIDAKKPVTITRNDETVFDDIVRPRLSVLIDVIAELRDPNQVFDRVVKIR